MPRKTKDGSKIRRESAEQRRLRLAIPDRHCTWCRKRIPKKNTRSRLWCGEACVEAFKIVNWPQHLRRVLEQRDRGICAICGTDTIANKELLKSLRRLAWDYGLCQLVCWLGKPIASAVKLWRPWKYARCRCVFCVAVREAEDLSRWEADHITPVVEGGGQCGLENYRTLCRFCHKRETKLLAARRAAERKSKKSRDRHC